MGKSKQKVWAIVVMKQPVLSRWIHCHRNHAEWYAHQISACSWPLPKLVASTDRQTHITWHLGLKSQLGLCSPVCHKQSHPGSDMVSQVLLPVSAGTSEQVWEHTHRTGQRKCNWTKYHHTWLPKNEERWILLARHEHLSMMGHVHSTKGTCAY